MESYFGVKVGMGVQGYTFETGSAENKKIASNVMSAIDAKVLEIHNANLQSTQPNLDLTKTAIFNDIKNRITETITIDKGEFTGADGIKKKRTEVISRLKKDKNGEIAGQSEEQLNKAAERKITQIKNMDIADNLKQKKIKAIKDRLTARISDMRSHVTLN